MGILTKKHNEDWVIEVRETWKVPQDEYESFMKRMFDLRIPMNVSFQGTVVICEFSNSTFKCTHLSVAKTVLGELLDLKKKYGDIK